MSATYKLVCLFLSCAALRCGGLPEGAEDDADFSPLALGTRTTTALLASPPVVYGAAGSAQAFVFEWEARPTAEDLLVLVHFVDAQGDVAFADEVEPPEPTTTWSGHVTQTFAINVPSFAEGSYAVMVGLVERHPPWQRVELLAGTEVVADAELRYRVATLDVGPRPEDQMKKVTGAGGMCMTQVESHGLVLAACDGSTRQQFRIHGDTLVAADGSCVEVPNDEHTVGARLRTAACDLSGGQAWVLIEGRIISNEGRCVGTGDASDEGAPLALALCDGGIDQQWRFSIHQEEAFHE